MLRTDAVAREWQGKRSLVRLIVLLGLALVLAALCMHHTALVAHASSNGTVVVTPSSGPVGAHVDVEVHLMSSTQAQYILRATTTDPTQGGCASACVVGTGG